MLTMTADEGDAWTRSHELLVDLLLDTAYVDDKVKVSGLGREQFRSLGDLQLAVAARMERVETLLDTMLYSADIQSEQLSLLTDRVTAGKEVVKAVTSRLSDAMSRRIGCNAYEQATLAWRGKSNAGVGLDSMVLEVQHATEIEGDETQEAEGDGGGQQVSGVCPDCEGMFAGGEQEVVCRHVWQGFLDGSTWETVTS
jgi:hypothetical protein